MSKPTFSEILEQTTARCRTMDAPLGERLQAFADEVRLLSPEFAEIVDRMVLRLEAAGAGDKSPAPGEPMPRFLLPDQGGSLVGLDAMLSQGPVVVSFHRGHWCPYCRINADALAKAAPELNRFGAQIVAITPETQEFVAELKQDAEAPFPILSDIDNAYALQLNLAIWINDEKRNAMTASGWDIAPYQRNAMWTLPIPATFVVGTDGLVKARFVDPDYRRRMPVEDILAALEAA